MLLHEFMIVHRDEILKICRKKLRGDVKTATELVCDVELFFQGIVDALRRDQGVAEAPASPPGRSEARQRGRLRHPLSDLAQRRIWFLFLIGLMLLLAVGIALGLRR